MAGPHAPGTWDPKLIYPDFELANRKHLEGVICNFGLVDTRGKISGISFREAFNFCLLGLSQRCTAMLPEAHGALHLVG